MFFLVDQVQEDSNDLFDKLDYLIAKVSSQPEVTSLCGERLIVVVHLNESSSP